MNKLLNEIIKRLLQMVNEDVNRGLPICEDIRYLCYYADSMQNALDSLRDILKGVGNDE